jgi:hypothetical protein
MGISVCEECCFDFCCVNLQLISCHPVDGLPGTHLEFFDIPYMSLLVDTHPTLSTKERPLTPDTLWSTQVISPDLFIAKMMKVTGKPCGISACTRCLWITLPSITISIVCYVRKLAIHYRRSLSIPLLLIWQDQSPPPCTVDGCHDVN